MSQELESVEAFARNELDRIARERDQRLRDSGNIPYLKLPKGTTRLTLLKAVPKLSEFKGKPRREVSVNSNGKDYLWTMSPNSGHFEWICEHLPKAPGQMDVIRIGEGMDTKYDMTWIG